MAIVMMSAGQSMAQDKVAKANDKKMSKTPTKPMDAKADQAAAPKMKKDGTPDMRYKENKETKQTAAPAGPTKKDGTPDMRHKANKDAAAKSAK